MFLQTETYILSTYLIMMLSVISFVLIIQSLKGSDLPIASIKLFQLYFILGAIGWLIGAYEKLNSIPYDLKTGASFYLICNFILFLAVIECTRKWKITWMIGFIHLLLILFSLMVKEATAILTLLAIYILFLFPPMFYISIKRSIKNSNIGNAIIAFAILISILSIPVLLNYLLVQDLPHKALNILYITAAIGYILVGIGFLTSILINEHRLLSSMALKDPLTGLYNRRGMDYSLSIVLATAKRNQSLLSVIAIDIDFFKKINDTFGHDGGDEVLKSIASMLLNTQRETDVCCRLGGEEFIIAMAGINLQDTLIIAERLRNLFETTEIQFDKQIIQLTASFGVACSSDGNFDGLLKNADKALYRAKSEGRNRVCEALE